MPHFKKLTPNLVVASVERSLAFYTGTLGFERGMTVPDTSPFVFASVTSGSIEVFFNDAATAIKEYPAFDGKPIGASGTRVLTTLIYALRARGGGTGVASLCIGGGMGIAMVIEVA